MVKGAVKKIRKRAKRKPYTFNVNAVNNRKKHRKERATMASSVVEEAWDPHKSTKQNLTSMGIAYDPNEALPVPSTKTSLRTPVVVASSSGAAVAAVVSAKKKKKLGKKATAVVAALEEEAAKERPSAPRVSEPEVLYAVRLIQRYGDDFKAMARDSNNHYQETPKQIKRKIEFFKTTHQYQAFLTAKDNVTNSK